MNPKTKGIIWRVRRWAVAVLAALAGKPSLALVGVMNGLRVSAVIIDEHCGS